MGNKNVSKDLKEHLDDFIKNLKKGEYKDKIYNEYSLQFELGYYLRDKGYNVFVEKNIEGEHIKHRTDLFIEDKNNNKKYAIELKYPTNTNGAYPQEMYEFIKEIKFMEEFVDMDSDNNYAYCLTLVDDDKFYSSTGKKITDNDTKPYYECFRVSEDSKIIINSGNYNRPTGKKKGEYSFKLGKTYETEWKNFSDDKADNKTDDNDNIRYYLISINDSKVE